MDNSLPYLHLAQAGKSLQRAKNNNYSDREKQEYQDNLFSLYSKILEVVESQSTASNTFKSDTRITLNFIYKSLEFLDSSTLNLIPYEIVECLKYALNDWNVSKEKYLIVTSLINNIGGFSFDPTLVDVESLYKFLKQKYDIEFTSRLVQINIPRALSRDYLASVVHYHELGHFVDQKNLITSSIARQLHFRLQPSEVGHDSLQQKLSSYFPYINSKSRNTDTIDRMLIYHLGEYFCDLFASQYVGENLSDYLIYISGNPTSPSITHPSPNNRACIVSDFLNGRPNIVVDLINEALQATMQKQLQIRFSSISTEDFYNFLPPIIEDERQLHGLLSAGWSVWKSDWDLFKQRMNMHKTPEPIRIYTIVNNLIEKSIGNFIITERWKNISTPLH